MASIFKLASVAAALWLPFGLAAADSPPSHLLSAAEMNADIDSLLTTLTEVHPNLYFKTPKPEAEARFAGIRANLTHPMGQSAFFELLGPVVNQLADGHTRLNAPPRPSPQSSTANPKKADSSDPWHFEILDGNVAYIDFRAMDRPLMPGWEKFLRQTFQTIADTHATGLIIDLRKNGGGASDLGDRLLDYVTATPYRPVSRKDWTMSERFIAAPEGEKYWTTIFPKELMAIPSNASPVNLAEYFAQNPPLSVRKLLRSEAPPEARAFLQIHAPHWLDPDYEPQMASRILTLKIAGLRTPPSPFPLRFTGPTCFLVGKATFSSAIILANSVQDFHLAAIAGEETPPCNQFGEIMEFKLPHSGLTGMVPSAQFVRANGDASDPHGVIPDLPCSQDPEDAKRGIDTVLSVAQNWVLNHPHSGS